MKKILINTLVILVILGVGILIGTKLSKKTVTQGEIKEDSYQAGWNAAKERLAQSETGMLISSDIRTINGVVEKNEGGKLEIKIKPLEPLADEALDTRIVTLNPETKIYLSMQKDMTKFQEEMNAFQERMMASQQDVNMTQLEAPTPFEKTEVKLSELKQGQQVSVTAGENIKDKKEFVAKEINVQQNIAMPNANQSSAQPVAPIAAPLPDAMPQAPIATTLPAAMPQAPAAPIAASDVIPATVAPLAQPEK